MKTEGERFRLAVAGAILALALPVFVTVAVTSSRTSILSAGTDDSVRMAKTAIAQFKYDNAKAYLEKALAAAPNDADALNLMGFTARKLGDPRQSLAYYNKALAQNPSHLGANEYLGELYLEMKDVKKAEERLSVLQQACGGNCEEYQDLKGKIDQFKLTTS
jgi:tetratricopeptide (TPR) repeat protein